MTGPGGRSGKPSPEGPTQTAVPVTGPGGPAGPAVRDDLVALEGYHSPRVDVAVRLNVNESPFPPPAAFVDAFVAELASVAFNRYPDREARALRAAVGELHGVGPEQVLVGKGSNEVLQAVCLAYGGPGRTAATFEPTYALHAHIARVTGTAVAVGERRADFSLDPAEVDRVLAEARPAVTFLCSPNNPTGLVEAHEAVAGVVARAPGLVVVDEAYAEFSSWSAMPMAVAADQPVVVTRTYSKTWSLAAMRLGYLVGPPEVVAACEAVMLPYHLDAASQIAGRLALRFRAEMTARVESLVAERERLAGAMAALGVDVYPSGANFLLFHPRPLDGGTVWKGLLEHSVLVRDCSSWLRLGGCLRVTVGTSEENDLFLAALKEVLA